ncbi:uncharacterized protein plekhg2 isoform X2 [Denticeps clupeoides]|nr:pleckstrin homology domain-containing family G member 2 isoform X2 [Denticeps clupeoides]
MPEGAGRGSQKKPSNQAAKRPSSASSLSGIVSRMASSERGSRGSCTSVNTVCSDTDRAASLSSSASSASSASLQDGNSSSLAYAAIPAYPLPQRNGSDISLDLTPLSLLLEERSRGGRGGGARISTGQNLSCQASALSSPPKLSRLERVALEIVETEQAYVRDLKSIVEDYLGCIIDCGDLPLKPDEVSTLFCNIEDIYEFNSELLEDLERSPHAAAMAECFVERSEAFDIYTIYCMNYPNSVAILRDCMKNKCLVRFFQERQATLNQSLPLETYLLKPVQRILKYHLLLQELSKHFDKSDPGYAVVEDAIITMTAVAWYINDMKRKQEHAVRLQEIESLLVNWTGPELCGFGELVLEGSFRVQRVKKERAFFLFDKMLLIAKKRLDHFVYSTHIFCCNLLLVENMKDPLCFKVSDQTIPKQQHTVQAKNQEEKRLWLHYLKRLIVENHPASLPQKARQVLGDNFCQSIQFEKPMSSPYLDDSLGYHRGRRQSEPPEFIYTPEKAKKSLPQLIEGNLPYRRRRRQSAPAKDIEAAFQQNVTLKAGSEGELCPQADSLGSSGSASTLASSVIEVEPVRDDLGQCQDEDDIVPLTPPPTLSITEEIMQFINQSRVREGLTELQANVTSVLAPSETHATGTTAEGQCDEPMVGITQEDQHHSQRTEGEEIIITQRTDQWNDETPMAPDKSLHALADPEAQLADGNIYPQSDLSASPAQEGTQPTSDLHTEEPTSPSEPSCQLSTSKIATKISNDEDKWYHSSLLGTVGQSSPLDKTDSQLSKSDRQILEKIRNYYEAAETEGEAGLAPRRNSFSHIPAGLVKESVSRFNVCVHQDSLCESESGRSDAADGELCSTPPMKLKLAGGMSSTANQDMADGSVPEQCDKSQPCKDLMKIWKEKDKGEVTGEPDITVKRPVFCSYVSEEEPSVEKKGENSTKNCQFLSTPSEYAEPDLDSGEMGQFKEDLAALKSAKLQDPNTLQSVGRNRDNCLFVGSVDCLPSQIKVSRWSCSRTLYEDMADVTSIGLFEDKSVDHCLVENSEKILNKVQMLARMYSAKASTMKMPLHQKRTRVYRESWAVTSRVNTQPQQTKEKQGPNQECEIICPGSPQHLGHAIVKEQLSPMFHQEDGCVLPGPVENILIKGLNSPESEVLKQKDCFSDFKKAAMPSEVFLNMDPSLETSVQSKIHMNQPDTATEAAEQKKHEDKTKNRPTSESSDDRSGVNGLLMENLAELSLSPNSNEQLLGIVSCGKGQGHMLVAEMLLSSCQDNTEIMPVSESNMASLPKGNSDRDPEASCPTSEISESLVLKTKPKSETVTEVKLKSQGSTHLIMSNDDNITENSSSLKLPNATSTSQVSEKSALLDQTYIRDPRNYITEEVELNKSVHSNFTDQCLQKIAEGTFNSSSSGSSQTELIYTPPLQIQEVTDQTEEGKKEVGSESGALNSTISPLVEHLPNFTSERPANIPTSTGKQSIPHLLVSSSLPVSAQRLQGFTDDKFTPASGAFCSALGTAHPLDTKPPSAFSPRLRLRSPSPVRGFQHTESSPSHSALVKSLAASCISQSISQSIAKRNARIQTASPPGASTHTGPVSPQRFRSPSPKTSTVCSGPPGQSSGMGNLPPKCPPSPFRSNSFSSVASSPPPYRSQRSVSPAPPVSLQSNLPCSPPYRSQRSVSPAPPVSLQSNLPCSPPYRSQRSVSPAPPVSLQSNLPCSPPYRSQRSVSPAPPVSLQSRPQEQCLETNLNSNNNNNKIKLGSEWGLSHKKPPLGATGTTTHCHDMPRGTSHNRVARPYSASEPNSRVQSPSPSPSPFIQICSPPLSHGALVNKTPNPRISQLFSPVNLSLDFSRPVSSPSCGIPRVTSPLPIGIPTSLCNIASPQARMEKLACTSSSTRGDDVNSKNFRISSPPLGAPTCTSTPSQDQKKFRGAHLPFLSLADRPPSPARSDRKSWRESGRWSVSVDQDSGLLSPEGGSYSGTPLCSPGPLSPVSLAAGKGIQGGKHFMSIAWPDVNELLTKYNIEDGCKQEGLPSPAYAEACFAEPDQDPDVYRSSLICAYANHNTLATKRDTEGGRFEDPMPSQGTKDTLKTSYATTVNLQIAGSGRITSFSNAQVSLTQTLNPSSESQGRRRVSINGCNISMPQNCKRL